MSDWQPSTNAEVALRDALLSNDQEMYFRVLSRSDMLLPVTADALAGRTPMGWGTWTADDRTHLLVFTSLGSMRACLAENAGSARQMSFQELAKEWPNHEWWLAVNPGLPIEGYLPAWFVMQLSRGDVRLPGQSSQEARGRLERVEAMERAKAARAAGPARVIEAQARVTERPRHAREISGRMLELPTATDQLHSASPIPSFGPAAAGGPYPIVDATVVEEQQFEQAGNGQPAGRYRARRAAEETGSFERPDAYRRPPTGYQQSGPVGQPERHARPDTSERYARPEAQPEPIRPVEPQRPVQAERFVPPERPREPEPYIAPAHPSESVRFTHPDRFAQSEPVVEPPWAIQPEPPVQPAPFSQPETYVQPEPYVAPAAFSQPEAYIQPEQRIQPEPVAFAESEPELHFDPEPAPGEPAGPFTPANSVEEQLLDAAEAGNTDAFVSTLLLATVLLEMPLGAANGSQPGDEGFPWHPRYFDDVPHLVCYTSLERIADDLGAAKADAVPVRFIRLIRSWPDPDWSFAVNPDTPVGAKLPGSQLVALATWAAELGLVDDIEGEPAPPAARVRSSQVPARAEPEVTVMQKPIAPSQVGYYLERGYDRVSGFVHRAREVGHLRTPDQLRKGLGLHWQGSPFEPEADEIYVLRWSAYRPSLYRIPYGGQHEAGMRAMEGWVIERAPFRGNGFAAGDSETIIAEFKVDSARLPHGARLLRIGPSGVEEMIAILDSDEQRWLRTDGGDGTPDGGTA